MPHPSAGSLNQRVAVRRPVRTQDGAGQMVDGSPTTVATRWASVTPIAGAAGGIEKDLADKLTAETTHIVELSDNGLSIQATDFLLWRGHTLQIEAVFSFPPEGRFLILCKETT